MRDLSLFFKGIHPERLSDPGPQLRKVLVFKKRIEGAREHLYRDFDALTEFTGTLDGLLHEWARLTQDEKLPDLDPGIYSTAEEPHREDEYSVDLDEAERLANEGKLVESETIFSRAVVGHTDLDPVNRYGNFLMRVGRLTAAQAMYERVGELAERGSEWEAKSLGNLAIVFRNRGELDRAEEMYLKGLEIDKQIGHKKGMAAKYGNLGVVYHTRGELDRAEEMYRKALEIHEQISHKGGMADNYGNLGIIYADRGDLDRAEEMHLKALEIHEQLGRKEGMADNYGNLGNVYADRGDLDRAEELHLEALEIEKGLGRKGGMADNYDNLADLYDQTDRSEQAAELREKAAGLRRQMGIE